MEINEARLREQYATQSSEQLLELYARGTLTAQANAVIEAVLDERGVPSSQRAAVAAATQARLAAHESELRLHQYLRASWASRLLARCIDTAIVVAMATAAGAAGVGVLGAVLFSAALLYFMFADALPEGQSVGKRLTGLAVVDVESLEPCSGLQAIQRNRLVADAFGWLLTLVLAIGRGRPGFRGATMVVRRGALLRVRRRG